MNILKKVVSLFYFLLAIYFLLSPQSFNILELSLEYEWLGHLCILGIIIVYFYMMAFSVTNEKEKKYWFFVFIFFSFAAPAVYLLKVKARGAGTDKKYW